MIGGSTAFCQPDSMQVFFPNHLIDSQERGDSQPNQKQTTEISRHLCAPQTPRRVLEEGKHG